MSGCPSSDQLRQLLADQLDAAERAILEAHVKGCAACQAILARLSDEEGGSYLLLLRQLLPEADAGLVSQSGEQPPLKAGDGSTIDVKEELADFASAIPSPEKRLLSGRDGLHIRRELGRGRFGVVYEALDDLNRLVAVKVLKPALAADPCERARFEREARKAAAVRHDHIVTVYRVGEAVGTGLPYLVMEYLAGETLAFWLRRVKVLPSREAAELVRQVALGLAAAHAHGLVHRDIKPSNILLESDGHRAKITDFGLARIADGDSGTGPAEAVVGTPAYMSPEQITTPGMVDERSDVYSLGVVLYEVLTGEWPFRGQPQLVMKQALQDQPRPPRQLHDAVPRDLETITLKCLAKEPGRRYPNAAELAEDLRRWQEGRPIRARPIRMSERLWCWCRRQPGLASAIGAAGLFLVLGSLAAALLAILAWGEARRADREAASAHEAKRLSDRHYYASEMKLASRDWEAGQLGLVQQRLRNHEPHGAGAPDLRGFEWYYLQRRCEFGPRTFQGHTGSIRSVAFSPDGRRLASASRDATVRVWDTATGQTICTFQGHTAEVFSVAFSPDGRHLASASGDQTVKLWDVASGQELRTLRGHAAEVFSVAFSPDGHYLASAGRDQTVTVWEAATGRELRTLHGHIYGIFGVTFSPDSRWLASASRDGTIRVWEAATGQGVFNLRAHTGWLSGVAFTPDGCRIAFAGQDGTVRLWDAVTGQESLAFQGHAGSVTGVAFSPDSRRVASAGEDGTVWLWEATTGQECLAFQGHSGSVAGVAFSPDGDRLASASLDGTVRVWDTATGQSVCIFQEHTDDVLGVAFSPDGRRLASISRDGTVWVWDAATGRKLHVLEGSTRKSSTVGFPFRPAFSPDGRWLAAANGDQLVKVWDAATGRKHLTLKGHTTRVRGVAFSPDGRQLASTSGDQTVRVWDTATGQELLCLKGHTGPVRSVVFSPDGRRLASSGQDVKVWDATTGQELLALQGHTGPVWTVAFSPDGRRLASASQDGTVRVWDATELTPAQRIDCEARGLVQFLFTKLLSAEEVAAAVCRDPTITEAVRLQALAWVEPCGRIRVRAEAARLVEPLFAKPLLRDEVLAALRADSRLGRPVHQEALRLAETFPENARVLNHVSWTVVCQPGADAAIYPRALRQAEAACRLAPNNRNYLSTLAAAYYRTGKYAEALATLGRSAQLCREPAPVDVAFLAMTQHQLGQTKSAQAALAQLHELTKQPSRAANAVLQNVQRETEELLGEKHAAPGKP